MNPGDLGLLPLPGRLLEDLNGKIQRLEDATRPEGARKGEYMDLLQHKQNHLELVGYMGVSKNNGTPKSSIKT